MTVRGLLRFDGFNDVAYLCRINGLCLVKEYTELFEPQGRVGDLRTLSGYVKSRFPKLPRLTRSMAYPSSVRICNFPYFAAGFTLCLDP